MFAISTVDKNGIRDVEFKTERRQEAIDKYGEIYDGLFRDDEGRAYGSHGREVIWLVCEEVSDASALTKKYPDSKAGLLLHATRTRLSS